MKNRKPAFSPFLTMFLTVSSKKIISLARTLFCHLKILSYLDQASILSFCRVESPSNYVFDALMFNV